MQRMQRMQISAIRDELLHTTDDDWLGARRKIATIAALLAAEFALLGMRQYGVIRRLPDPPLPGFDSNAVITSRAAYPLGVPALRASSTRLQTVPGTAAERRGRHI